MTYDFLDLKKVMAPYADEIKEAIGRVVDSGRYVGGPEVEALENKLKELSRVPHAIGVSNGLDALRLILRGYMELGAMKEGDEIIVPANTYVATVLAITDCHLVPVLVDADAATLNIDTSLIEQAVTPRTRAIMTVHLYGRTAWDEAMRDIALQHGLKVIEDNAQAIGAKSAVMGLHGSDMSGGLGDAAAFSFYPTKNIGAMGDGGAVTTHDEELARAVRAIANYGSDRRYHNIYQGLNCRLDPIQAAIIGVRLDHIKDENGARFANAVCYRNELHHPDVTIPEITPHLHDQVWHQYVITTPRRAELVDYLAANGVATDIHYATPPHLQPCYAGKLSHGPLPVTERLANEVLSLPISSATSVKEASEIAHIINEFPML